MTALLSKVIDVPLPGNIPGLGWHEPGEAPADLCGWEEGRQACEGTAATALGEPRWAVINLALNL